MSRRVCGFIGRNQGFYEPCHTVLLLGLRRFYWTSLIQSGGMGFVNHAFSPANARRTPGARVAAVAAKGTLFTPNPQLRLRAPVREVMRFFHYSERTEEV